MDKEILHYNNLIKLYKLVKHTLKNIEYYKNNFSYSKNINFSSLEEFFSSYPILDKKTISQNINNLQSNPKIRRVKKNTGGSTGSPFAFYLERFITREKEKAFIFDNVAKQMSFSIEADEKSPVVNPCFILNKWNGKNVSVRVNGAKVKDGDSLRIGKVRDTEGDLKLIIWLEFQSEKSLKIEIISG